MAIVAPARGRAMPQFNSCFTCQCGAKYERGEARLPIRDIGIQECAHCGVVIERWHGKLVPVFRLVSAPEEKKSASAA
ncbi:MAG TPA: hypothetical protein PLS69_13220 [Terricaulis sp.]|nr:hypothetical protein [Terricaulis sp.]